MPNIKSAKKRVRVNATKAARNKSANTALKTAIKKANIAVETNAADKAELEPLFKALLNGVVGANIEGILGIPLDPGLLQQIAEVLADRQVQPSHHGHQEDGHNTARKSIVVQIHPPIDNPHI